MITFAPRFPATWLSETYRLVLTTIQDWPANSQMLGKNKYVIYLLRSVSIEKNCALGLEYSKLIQSFNEQTNFRTLVSYGI